MKIKGLNKTTLLDYPGRVACTVFLGNCNMRCIYCQNSSLILNPQSEPDIPEEDFFSFLEKRKDILQGVCITGGEPTLSPDLSSFIKKIRSYSLDVKLDTNGLNPDVIDDLISNSLINYIAMDIKGPLYRYSEITGISDDMLGNIQKSCNIIMNSKIDYEFRTTTTDSLLSVSDFENIGKWLKSARAYYIQPFVDSSLVLTKGLKSPSKEQLLQFLSAISPYIENSFIRGMD